MREREIDIYIYEREREREKERERERERARETMRLELITQIIHSEFLCIIMREFCVISG